MDFCEKITCCRYIPEPACQRSALRNFRGTLAVGTESGKLFLIDLMIPSEWKGEITVDWVMAELTDVFL